MNRKKLIVLVLGIMLVGLLIGKASAEDSIGTTAVTGNNYICYFITPLGDFNSQVTFGTDDSLALTYFSGYGFYLPIANLFTAGYYALQETIGTQTGDIIMLLAGASFDPIIAGAGTLVVEYSTVYFVVFGGVQATQQ